VVRHLRHFVGASVVLSVTAAPLLAQGNPPAQATPVAEQFNSLHFRSIGPATMSGRIADLAVYEANPAIYYAATAHGGLFKTTSNGATFIAQFQDKGLIALGDVTISQTNPNLVWVGAGESNNRQSTSWGGGVFKSTDGGTTFELMGLANSKHINRIVIDPNDNNVVLVAATGPLFGSGGDRGIYKTTDGGRTWRKVLAGDDWTGANDIAMSATNPRTLFASMYQRNRTTCCMNGGGPGSGIWRSTDGGDTWTRLTGNGLPAGPLGRIAVDVFRKSGNFVYALIEGPNVGGRGGGRAGAGGAEGGRAAGPAPTSVTGLYRSDDGGTNWRVVNPGNPRPMYFSQLKIDPNSPDRVYLGGVGLWMTVDGGRSFEQDAALVTHDDIHSIWVNPANSDHILIGNDGGLAVSYDGSKTWTFVPNLPVGLFYHVGYDMEIPYNICGGMQDNYNWCGPSASRHNRGIFNYDWFQIQGGDGFVAQPDLRESRIIYTESQDGNIIRRDKITGESKNIRPTALNVTPAPAQGESFRWHWDTPIVISPNDPGTLIVAANRVFTSRDRGDSWTVISPDLTKNANRDTITTMLLKGSEISIAENDGISQWPAIVTLAESPAQAGVIYTGTDDGTVSVTRNGGQTWTNISRNLPGLPPGFVYISEVVPSRFSAGTVYVTADNHRENDYEPHIWMSTDFGATFRSINGNLRGENVRTLTEDTKNANVLYIGTETGIFVSLDKGGSWYRLKGRNFPTVRVDELTIHPRDNALLVATHGRAIWVLDHLEPIQEFAASYASAREAKLFTVPTALQWKSKDDRNDEFWGHQFFTGENPPTDAVIQFYLKAPVTDLKVRISDGARTIRTLDVPAAKNVAGIQTVCWDQRIDPLPTLGAAPAAGGGGGGGGGGRAGAPGPGRASAVPGIPEQLPPVGYMAFDVCGGGGAGGGRGGGGFGGGGGGNAGPHVPPGSYTVALVAGTRTIDSKPMRIIMDPQTRLSATERTRWTAVTTELHDAQRRGNEVQNTLNALHPQMTAAVTAVAANTSMPANVKSQFEALNRDYEAVRVKFGVPVGAAQGGRGGGGGGRGGGAPDPNVLARLGAVKGAIMGIWEPPSAAMTTQATSARSALAAAISEANAVIARARTVSTALRPHNVTINVP
jgi:photosystem II stability/assembly factor-like uncharacterized protein